MKLIRYKTYHVTSVMIHPIAYKAFQFYKGSVPYSENSYPAFSGDIHTSIHVVHFINIACMHI